MKALTAAEMREVDRLTTERYGVPGLTLMENAGTSAAEFIRHKFPNLAQRRVVVLCGKGNNGGDGFVVARKLRERGANPVVYLFAAGGRDARRRGGESQALAGRRGRIAHRRGRGRFCRGEGGDCFCRRDCGRAAGNRDARPRGRNSAGGDRGSEPAAERAGCGGRGYSIGRDGGFGRASGRRGGGGLYRHIHRAEDRDAQRQGERVLRADHRERHRLALGIGGANRQGRRALERAAGISRSSQLRASRRGTKAITATRWWWPGRWGRAERR